MIHTADWLCGSFFFSTVSLNISYQILVDIQRNSRKLTPYFAAFLKTTEKNSNYSQKVHILLGIGAICVLRPEILNLAQNTFSFSGVAS